MQAEVLQSLLDARPGPWLGQETCSSGFLFILLGHNFGVTHGQQHVTLYPSVAVKALVQPLYFVDVLLGFGVLLAIEEGVWDDSQGTLLLIFGIVRHVALLDLQSFRANEQRLLPLLPVVIVDLFRLILQRLSVICTSKAPQDVINSSLVQVLLQMVGSVLSNIRQSHVLVPPDRTSPGLKLTDEKLDGSGLTSPIGTNNSHTRSHANRQADILNGQRLMGWVLEVNILHLEDGVATGLHTFEGPWKTKESQLIRFAELKVSTLLRKGFDVLRKHFTLGGFKLTKLALMQIHNVCVHILFKNVVLAEVVMMEPGKPPSYFSPKQCFSHPSAQSGHQTGPARSL